MSKEKKTVKKEKTITLTIKEAKKVCEIIEENIDWDGGINKDDDKDIQIAFDLLEEIKKRIKKAR